MPRVDPVRPFIGGFKHQRSKWKSIIAIEPGVKDNAKTWEFVFNQLIECGLDTERVTIGIMDELPGLETVLKSTPNIAVEVRCWVHILRNTRAKTLACLSFNDLKIAMEAEVERAMYCLEKDLDALLAHAITLKKVYGKL